MKARFDMIFPRIALLLLFWLIPLIGFGQQAQLLGVIDGDTLSIRLEGKKEHLRLIGIDTPESRENQKAWRDAERSHRDIKTLLALGERASHHTEALLKGVEDLRLEFDAEKRDRYDRLLAYVHLPSGEMLNERLLLDGYAQLLTVPPNVRYSKRFKALYETARKKKVGLWAD